MKIDILTLFPGMFAGPFSESILKRAQKKELVKIKIHNLRDWAKDKHKTVDDRPYGGGTGMILKVDLLYQAIKSLKGKHPLKVDQIKNKSRIILLDPTGPKFNQKKALEFSKLDYLLLICGHYEGVDHRVNRFVDEKISIGDYILTGGEIPALAVTDAVVRLIPGVIENPNATKLESFSLGENSSLWLEHPHYTRPEKFRGLKVPEILLSGDHQKIEKWRQEKARQLTQKNRPDLLKKD